jgi:hypothetical protein
LSEFDEPVSLAASRSGVDGAAGARLSVVTVRAADAGPCPSTFVARAVIELAVLSGIADVVVTEYAPLTVATALPIGVDPAT